MSLAEINDRVAKGAGIATNPGPTFGTGGELCQRFNIATSRSTLEKACARLAENFADLQ